MTPELSSPIMTPKRIITKQAGRYRQLSNNSAEWGRQIMDALHNENQELNKKKLEGPYWESKDDIKGTAVGRMIVGDESGRKMAVPLIVENFKLAPLDTYTDAQSKPHRINPRRLKKALFTSDLFTGIVTPQDERGLMPDIPLYRSYGVLPWEEGRRVYAALEDMLPYATEADLEKFAEVFHSDPQIAVNFFAHGHGELIGKILNTRPQPMSKLADDLLARLPASVVQLKFLPDQTLVMKVASDALYAPQEIHLAREQFRDTLQSLGFDDDPGIALKQASSPLGFNLTLRESNVEPLFTSDLRQTEPVSKFGSYVVQDISGKDHVGYVFPLFYSLSKKAMNKALFVSPTLSVMQSKIAGLANPNPPAEVPSCLPTPGDVGCFVYEKEAGALALEPVTIRTVEGADNAALVTADTLSGTPVFLHISKSATDLVKTAESAYLLPAAMKFVKLSNLKLADVLTGDAKELTKTATEALLGTTYCRVASPVGGRFITLQGPLAEKMGCAGVEQYPEEAVFKLACMGLSIEGALDVMERAQGSGKVVVGGLNDIKPARDFLGQEKRAQHMQALATLNHFKPDVETLVKCAADIEDPSSVNRVLSLCVLNPQNLGVLLEHMDDYENTGTRLSEMLLASRLGKMDDLNESAIIQARQALDDVLDGAAKLRSRLGPQTSSEETGGSSA